MIHRHTIGNDAVVVAIGDGSGDYFLTIKSGKAAIALHLAPDAAARVRSELDHTRADVSPRHPVPPSANWRALISRMDKLAPLPGDADRLRDLFHHLRFQL